MVLGTAVQVVHGQYSSEQYCRRRNRRKLTFGRKGSYSTNMEVLQHASQELVNMNLLKPNSDLEVQPITLRTLMTWKRKIITSQARIT